MLNEDPDNLRLIVAQIINYHRNGTVTDDNLGIVISGNSIHIDYGFQGTQYGMIEMQRGQFTVTRVTNADGMLVPTNYNHSNGDNTKYQDYINALKCADLSKSTAGTRFSAIVILTAECARSEMVLEALATLLTGYQTFSADSPGVYGVWPGLKFAFNTYGHTAEFTGYNIQAGGQPWNPLTAQNYIDYINSDAFTGSKDLVNNIHAVEAYYS